MATRCSSFEVGATCGAARTGLLRLPHGEVPTPAFMPVGTAGTVKGLTPRELREVGAHMVLANTYHLWVRPGHERVARLGGLHRLMAWDGPILTDSGGFQAFSFRDKARANEDGVRFLSSFDRQWRFMTPEVSVRIQETLGVDVAMALDECIELTDDRRRVVASTARTTRWLKRCLAARERADRTALFGIVQGGFFAGLREAHARELADMDLDGYAIGGLSVGEGQERMMSMVEVAVPALPADRPRYLMGVGYPSDLVEAVRRGVDLFDCVLPTRTARFGYAFTRQGRMAIKHARFADDPRPIDPACACYTCRSFSRAYLRHLHLGREMLAPRLLSLHNLAFYQDLMQDLQSAIRSGPAALSALAEQAALAGGPWQEAPPADGVQFHA